MREIVFTPLPAVLLEPYDEGSVEEWKNWWKTVADECGKLFPLSREERLEVVKKLVEFGLSAYLIGLLLRVSEAAVNNYTGVHEIMLRGREPKTQRRNKILKEMVEADIPASKLLEKVAAKYRTALDSLIKQNDWGSRTPERQIKDISQRVGSSAFSVRSFLEQHPKLVEEYNLGRLLFSRQVPHGRR